MVSAGQVQGDRDELGALLQVCDEFVRPEVVAAMHTSAERLFPILVACDAKVGVVQSKIYDAKLVLSMVARRAVEAGLRGGGGEPATYAAFGLGKPDADTGKVPVEDRELVRDLVFTLMSLHLEATEGLYLPPAQTRWRVLAAIAVCKQLPVLKKGLIICDTGVDRNEDDLSAIMMVANLNLLPGGAQLDPALAALDKASL